MSVTAKALIDAHFALATDNTEYSAVSGVHTIIDKLTATNTDAAAQTLSINIVPGGGSPATSNLVIQALSLAAGATHDFTEIKNHILNPGDFISMKASVVSAVVIRASGREVQP